jgi:hypothetical protein
MEVMKRIFLLLYTLCLFFPLCASAQTLTKAQFKYNHVDAMQCINAISYYEKRYKIPHGLLHSIALTESGTFSRIHKALFPWPWTINVDQKGYFFSTKREAIEFAKQQVRMGAKHIDVGCHQINMYHHGKNFSNIEQAFNPVHNTRYAAELLLSHYKETKNWEVAVARYHSYNEAGQLYKARVYEKWAKFKNDQKIYQHPYNHKYAYLLQKRHPSAVSRPAPQHITLSTPTKSSKIMIKNQKISAISARVLKSPN